MNKKTLVVFLQILLSITAKAQEPGIHFEHNLNWQQVQAKAKAENKYIFVDCYTTWCKPCKVMSANIFPLQEVGDYFNDHFISVKVQMDQTKKDSDFVRSWYQDAKMIADQYSITSYPTSLFFTSDGKVIHRFSGSVESGNEFVTKAKDVFDQEKQYYTNIELYKDHLSDSAYLRNALILALSVQDNTKSAEIADLYCETLVPPFTKYEIEMMSNALVSSKNKAFQLFITNAHSIDSVKGKYFVDNMFLGLVYQEQVTPLVETANSQPDWEAMRENILKKYPTMQVPIKQAISAGKMDYLSNTKNYRELIVETLKYLDDYKSRIDIFVINNLVWNNLYLHSNDPSILKKALHWSKLTIASYPAADLDCANLDTYASLLYKTGDKKNAIIWEKRAVATGPSDKIKRELELRLDKMIKSTTLD